MNRTRCSTIPLWKQAIAVALAMYCFFAWCLPIFLLPFVNILPYVHNASEATRILISAACSVAVVATLFFLGPGQFIRSVNANESGVRRAKQYVLVLGGLALFTYMGGVLSPNLFGAASKALPSINYEQTVVLTSMRASGSRFRSVALTYLDPVDARPRYLVLSRRLFEYPSFHTGETVTLYGYRGVLGQYVTGIRRRDA